VSTPLPALTGLTADEVAAILAEEGQPAYRATQVLDWVYQRRASTFAEMTNLPAALRESLSRRFRLQTLIPAGQTGSMDTTFKYLFRLHDGRYVEAVLIPANPALYGESADRRTLCVSSQVGCAYGCKFCASGLAGFARNLTVDEITNQILMAEKLSGEKVNNLVFMGMGEPLANLPNLLKAIEIITSPWGLNIGSRHLTVSTSGLVPQIRELALNPRQIRLAISLHGATDEVRNRIMPINKKWPIAELMEALHYWTSKKKQKITFEYILIDGVNDSLDQARILAKLARSLKAKVNLIPYNTVEGLEWKRPSAAHCRAFADIVRGSGNFASLRLEKGHDIAAACGQLRLKQETEDGIIEAPIKVRG
jgi:23S rRNA (adenine2503-C2)-methyltransferase